MKRWLSLFATCALCACHSRKPAEPPPPMTPLPSPSPIAALSPTPTDAIPAWPTEIAHGRLPYRQLTVEDFPVKEPGKGVAAFNVKTFIDPNWQFYMKAYNGFVHAYVKDWVVFAGFDKSSSYRRRDFRDMKKWLPYAQALLDLAELHARQFAAVPNGNLPEGRGATFDEATADLRQKLNAFCAPKYKEVEADMDSFAKATHNGEDRKKTRELAAEIRKRLAAQPTPSPLPDE